MKTSNQKLSLLVLGIALFATGLISSCSKTSNNAPSGPKPPTNPGGYDSSNQIQSASLLSYFSFNGTLTDGKGGLTATNSGSTFTSGLNGKQAYEGGPIGTYALYTPSAGIKSMTSFTIAFWLNSQQVDSDAQAILQLSNPTQYWPELDIDLESYHAASDSLNIKMYMENDSNNVWTVAPQGFLDTAVGKWTHFVVTYNAASGSVSMYENGTSIAFGYPYAPTGGSVGPITFYTSDPGSSTNTNGAPAWGAANFSISTGLVVGGWQGKTNPPLNPGEGSDTWNLSYAGALQNLRIYNTALNASDVKSLYILETGGF